MAASDATPSSGASLAVPQSKAADHDRRVSKIHTVLAQSKDQDALEPYASHVPTNTIFNRQMSDLDEPAAPKQAPSTPNPMASFSPFGPKASAAPAAVPTLSSAGSFGAGSSKEDDDARERGKMKEAFHENNKEMYRYVSLSIRGCLQTAVCIVDVCVLPPTPLHPLLTCFCLYLDCSVDVVVVAAAWLSQLLEEEDKDAEEDENFAFLFAKHRHGWFDRTFRTGKVMDDQVP